MVSNDLLDYRKAFGAIAVEQLLIAMTAQEKVELPNQVPNIMQPGIHPLPAKGAVNVSRVPGYEDASDAQLRCVPVMDAKIAAPVKGVRLDPAWRPLTEYLPHEFQRRSFSFRVARLSPRFAGGWRLSEKWRPGQIRLGIAAARLREEFRLSRFSQHE